MTAKQAITHIMKMTGWTQPALADTLDKKFGQKLTVQSLNERLSARRSTGLNTANFNVMLHALGYRIVVVPENLEIKGPVIEIDDGLTVKEAE